MAATTFEEAKQCPKCGQPGDDRKIVAMGRDAGLRPGTTVHEIYCMNPQCRWFDSPWMVQVNADGTIPPPQDHRGRDKKYVGFQDHDVRAKELIDSLKRDEQAQLQPGAEVRNPYA